jgi:hypothetical protein
MLFERELFVCRHERGLEAKNVDCTSLLAPAIFRLFDPHARRGGERDAPSRAAFEYRFLTSWCAGLRSRSTRCACLSKCSCSS